MLAASYVLRQEAIEELLDFLSRKLQRYNATTKQHDPTSGFEPIPPRNYLLTIRATETYSKGVASDAAQNILERRVRKADALLTKPKLVALSDKEELAKVEMDTVLRYWDFTAYTSKSKRKAGTADWSLACPCLPVRDGLECFVSKRRKVDFDRQPKPKRMKKEQFEKKEAKMAKMKPKLSIVLDKEVTRPERASASSRRPPEPTKHLLSGTAPGRQAAFASSIDRKHPAAIFS